MRFAKKIANGVAWKSKATLHAVVFSRPKNVQCNICGWEGRRFMSDPWHKHINCPRCNASIRQRLFFAALQHIEPFSFDKMIRGRAILHFAPERLIGKNIREKAARYVTADYLRYDCDYKLDMSDMPEMENESFSTVIAFDVLEHVPDYQKALDEVHRVLSPNGWAIFTVPQKDDLMETYEDPSIVSPEDRTKHFGQHDHLRMFGADFVETVEKKGFAVTAVDESFFAGPVRSRHVLFPPVLSGHPLATNYRKVFFCQKRT